MTTTNTITHRAIATLNLPLKVPALITYAGNVLRAITGNPHLPNLAPLIALLTAAIAALSTAESATLARTKGAVSARNAAKTSLVTLLQQLRGTVQTAADADSENGATIIESTGLSLRKTSVRAKRVFDAAQGPTTGSAKLVTGAAARRASYEWEYSTDGGKTWTAATPTLQASTVVPGLPAGTAVQFRYRSVVKGGASDWSAPVSLLVK